MQCFIRVCYHVVFFVVKQYFYQKICCGSKESILNPFDIFLLQQQILVLYKFARVLTCNTIICDNYFSTVQLQVSCFDMSFLSHTHKNKQDG